jgi:hypothetical protein
MTEANDFFTLQSLGTFAGATSATLCGANAIQYVFNVNPRWLALAIAEAVCVGWVAVTQIDGAGAFALTPYFVAVFNGFLVFTSAAGLTAVGAEVRRGGELNARSGKATTRGPEMTGAPRRGFFTPWL